MRGTGLTRAMSWGVGPRVMRRMPPEWGERPFTQLKLEPCTEVIGAEVLGIDLSGPLDDTTRDEIRRALLEWKVLFFRDQHLTSAQQVAFARRFGDLEHHPFLRTGDSAEVVRFEKGEDLDKPGSVGTENGWHSDVTWRTEPAMGSILRAVEVPERGGDTLWADMGCAYDNLPEDLRARIDDMRAVHSFVHVFGYAMSPERKAEMLRQYPPVEHPVVRTHPETGRKTLFVNAFFTERIVGLDDDESEVLVDRLCQQAMHPEWQVRLRWEPGTVAFWDNRSTQHYASSDYYPRRRVMERVAIKGDRPF
ncbi:MAG TPA: TauD/TfdA family dioxygenase [Acidimicrobiia bacterium]|nr:TauD/TfdA family dioxygenase [Acidimicrobiia bacterium]